MGKQRIEYIDAMRGFTMILVVYSHVCSMCLGDSWMGYNDVFYLFRMPCFFFISGWLFNPLKGTLGSVTKHKFMVQIVPTLIFLLLLAPPPLFFSKLGATKGGYWFTFVLFEFFIVSMLSERICKKRGLLLAVFISVFSFFYDAYYNRFFTQFSWMKDIVGFLSYKAWRFYLFFYMGILVKSHFDVFLKLTGKRYVIIMLLACFAITAYLPHYENVTVSYLIFAIGGMSGMIIIFTFFRYVGSIMSSYPNSCLLPLTSHLFCYIGSRTLDIFLLHYFFLPRFLLPFGESLIVYDCKPLEFLVALILALVIVAVCLLVSYIIRLSPFLGHYLFGVKY